MRRAFQTSPFFLALLLLLPAYPLFAQESSSRATPANSAAPAGPSAALRDALAAACSHDQKSFATFLTARNAESFSRLTEAARVELMKRFVLLADPGTPTLTADPAGRPIISCATPYGTAELHLGGVDLRDNLALLPLDLREASDPDSSNSHHVLMGMIRENGQWKVLSIGLLFLDLPSLEVEWDQAQTKSNEQAALSTLESLAKAIEAYRRTYLRLPETLSQLAPPAKGAVSPDAAGLIDARLATGEFNGFSFRYVIVGASDLGAPAKYELSATPKPYAKAGKLSFFRDSSGTLHAADHHGAVGSATDAVVKPE
jgi:hypothetical protein